LKISKLARSVNESPTLQLNAIAKKMIAEGKPVINLGVGEPDNPAPEGAVEAAQRKLKEGKIKYVPTAGMLSLREAIADYTFENYQENVAVENIVVSTGAKQALFNILFVLIDPGDEVLLLAPYWVSYPEMVRMVGGVPVVVHPSAGSFTPDFDSIRNAVTQKTKAVIVNSPSNPSGGVYSEEFVSQLVALCEEREIAYIADDIYQKLVFDGVEASPAFKFTDLDIENAPIIIVNGIAKSFGMTGFRIGWAVTNKEAANMMTRAQSQITSCASVISQAAAEGALRKSGGEVERLRKEIQANRDVAVKEIGEITQLELTAPQGTFYAFPKVNAHSHLSYKISELLLQKGMVSTVPGEPFGLEGHIRISFSGPSGVVSEGIRRIKWVLDENGSAEYDLGNGEKLKRDWKN